MKTIILAIVLLLAGCATSPEAKLVQGYKSATAVVKGTTVLVNRDAISVKDAENVHALGTTSKATLDSGKDALAACRATPGANCSASVANIDLGAGVLLQLENYLKAREGK